MPLTKTGWSEANYVAGALCLDFANTLSGRLSSRRLDRLTDYEQLISWGVVAGFIDGRLSSQLVRNARQSPRRAKLAYQQAVKLRQAIFGIFHASISGEPPATAHVNALNQNISRALNKRELVTQEQGFSWRWITGAPSLDFLLGPIALSAAELLVSPDLPRVRLCMGDHCAWLFVDRTKNLSRRWCDMAVCGNRAKSRRHYRASRKGK